MKRVSIPKVSLKNIRLSPFRGGSKEPPNKYFKGKITPEAMPYLYNDDGTPSFAVEDLVDSAWLDFMTLVADNPDFQEMSMEMFGKEVMELTHEQFKELTMQVTGMSSDEFDVVLMEQNDLFYTYVPYIVVNGENVYIRRCDIKGDDGYFEVEYTNPVNSVSFCHTGPGAYPIVNKVWKEIIDFPYGAKSGPTNNMFYQCDTVEHIDLKSVALDFYDMSTMFYYCNSLVSVDLGDWEVDNNPINWAVSSPIFLGCSLIENVTGNLTNILKSIDFALNPKLTRESALVFIKGLAHYDTVDAKRYLKFHPDTYNKLTDADKALATSKGWTLQSA